jgi:hypothetical protein
MATTSSPGPTSAPNLGAEDDGEPKLGSRKHMNAPDLPPVNRAIDANTLCPPLDPRSPSMPLVTDSDLDIADGLLREPNSGCTGDHSPHPSRYEYDMV